MKENIIKSLFAICFGVLISYPLNSKADTTDTLTKIFKARPGDRVSDDNEGKDLDKFVKSGECKAHYPWGVPKLKDVAVSKRGLYICNTSFASLYDPKLKISLWSSEKLEKANFEIDNFKHKSKIHLDEDFPKKMQQRAEDYLDSNYFPIQMVSENNTLINDLSIDNDSLKKLNLLSIDETFKFTNMAPLVKDNIKLWNELEEYTLSLIKKNTKMLVVTGVIYLDGGTLGTLKYSKTPIPTHYYRIIVNPESHGSVNYIIPNKPTDSDSISSFVVSIKEIERLTNMEFFPELAPHWAAQIKLNKAEYLKEQLKKEDRKRQLNEK